MSVSQALFRFYRPLILGFAGVMLAIEVVAVIVAAINGKLNYSTWLLFTGTAVRWWLVVVGIVLVALQLKLFMSNGRTRREFLEGMAKFLLTMSIGAAAVLALGHGLESFLVGIADQRGTNYPVATAGQILSDFGHTLPGMLACPLSGALIAVGFYRYRPLVGVVVMLLGAIPALAADYLLRIDGNSHVAHRGPYAVALLASLAITAVAAAVFQRMMSDVPVRYKAG